MKYVLLLLPILGILSTSSAEEMSVINVRRNIQLAETDPVYRDFYIDGGEASGLKKNMVVQAFRRMSIRDASGVHSFGDITIPVGQLKIIAVYAKISIAREYKLLSRDELPMLEQIGIMSGDMIELKGNFIDRRPMSVPQPVAVTPATALPTTPAQIGEAVVATPTVASTTAAPPAAPTTPEKAPAPEPTSPVTKPVITPNTSASTAVTTPKL